MPPRLSDLPTGMLFNAIKTNPNTQTFPWSVNGFANQEVPRSAVVDELYRRPDGREMLLTLKVKYKSEIPQNKEVTTWKKYESEKPRVVFVGNFSVPFSTESHHKWTWEQMGWEVTALQENQTSSDIIVAACQTAQVFQYTHTHGWLTGGSFGMDEALDRIRQIGIPSFSYHLDVYWGLNKLDQRENNIGKHPSWHVDYFFSTDGDHEKEYESRGINHYWLPPAVVEYGCYKGEFRPALESEIGFVGSTTYHPEYPFRRELIEGLQNHYGDRFRVYSGVREKMLNDVYASTKVVVGDHCFAGMPYYWSDRLPETCGRGGFILYPETEGLTIPTATYKPQDLKDLIEKIDYYLGHEEERKEIQNTAFEWVKTHDTYTQRMQEILNTIFD